MYQIKETENAAEWKTFYTEHTADTFHQSWEWGDINKKLGNTIWRLGLYQNSRLVALCLAIKIKAKRGTMLLVPHGPIVSKNIKGDEYKKIIKKIVGKLLSIGEQGDCGFVRIAPICERSEENKSIFTLLGFRKAPIFVQSEQSWILSLQKPQDELIKNMRKSTRQIIKRVDNIPVEIVFSTEIKDVELFYSFYIKTVERKHYVGHKYGFIKNECEEFLNTNQGLFCFAYHGKSLLATAFIITMGKSAYYHYGASVKSDFPAPHILHWNIILHLKERGYDFYNFWGIAPNNNPKHPWYGLTVFKKGFGGEERLYLQTQDYILKWSYIFTWVVEKIRKIKRGY